MPAQLELFDGPGLTFEQFMAAPATWYEGLPDLSGLAQFVVLIRSPFDPERRTRSQLQARHRETGTEPALAWIRDLKGTPEEWAESICALLEDGQSRTFNRIMLDLTERLYTADVAAGKAPEKGLWLAVERRRVFWAHLEDGAVWFALAPAEAGAGQ